MPCYNREPKRAHNFDNHPNKTYKQPFQNILHETFWLPMSCTFGLLGCGLSSGLRIECRVEASVPSSGRGTSIVGEFVSLPVGDPQFPNLKSSTPQTLQPKSTPIPEPQNSNPETLALTQHWTPLPGQDSRTPQGLCGSLAYFFSDFRFSV